MILPIVPGSTIDNIYGNLPPTFRPGGTEHERNCRLIRNSSTASQPRAARQGAAEGPPLYPSPPPSLCHGDSDSDLHFRSLLKALRDSVPTSRLRLLRRLTSPLTWLVGSLLRPRMRKLTINRRLYLLSEESYQSHYRRQYGYRRKSPPRRCKTSVISYESPRSQNGQSSELPNKSATNSFAIVTQYWRERGVTPTTCRRNSTPFSSSPDEG